MTIPVLKLINLSIILVFLVFLVRYIWDLFFGSGYEPAEWEHARKTKQISPSLLKEMKRYEDKVRFYTFWLQIIRLKRESIQGCFAELGVYKGETARIIHMMDPERDFHLFDTFEGFHEKDLAMETGEAATYTTDNFRDTTVEEVMKRINGDPTRLHIHKGYFPESAHGLESHTFALVSMDADLYNPTLAGLQFFYQRLSPGGIIIIHDYNSKWEGLQKAVNEFVSTISEPLVLIPDLFGSVMIVKSRK